MNYCYCFVFIFIPFDLPDSLINSKNYSRSSISAVESIIFPSVDIQQTPAFEAYATRLAPSFRWNSGRVIGGFI